jgi:hypothetical protein
MTDEDIIKVWDGLDAEAFDADTILRFARAILARAQEPAGPRHYRMTLETGEIISRSGPSSGDRG